MIRGNKDRVQSGTVSWLGVLLALALCVQSVVVGQDIGKILAAEYEYKMISSGKNFPSVNVRRNNLGEICVLLHHRVPPDAIRTYYGWTEDEFQARLRTLLDEGLVKPDGKSGYVPTCMVITLEDSRDALKVDEQLLSRSVQLIVDKLPEVQDMYRGIEAFKAIPFSRASLFVLSDVLLDNWQINSVERQWLKAERTLRNGMRYYYSIQQKEKGQATEAFGIYGNMYRGYGPVTVGVYGNQRQGVNFLSLSKEQLQEWFGMKETDKASAFKQRLLEELLQFAQGTGDPLDERSQRGFERLGFLEGGALRVPVLTDKDQETLSNLAALLTDELIALLQSYTEGLRAEYEQSRYVSEVSFEEYAIWWYHFYYTRVTDLLIEQSHIAKPASGIYTYLLR